MNEGFNLGAVFRSPVDNFGELVGFIVSNLYVLSGVVLFFLIIAAGFGILRGAGSGDKQQTAQGKQAITYAIIGFLIIFASYWIIQLIEAITGLKILNPGF